MASDPLDVGGVPAAAVATLIGAQVVATILAVAAGRGALPAAAAATVVGVVLAGLAPRDSNDLMP